MKHKTWFRLVLKAIGIVVIVLSIPDAVGMVWIVVREFVSDGAMPTLAWESWFVGHFIGHLIAIGIGLYLLIGGERLVSFCIPSNRDYCPNCGYDVSEAPLARRCSECGAVLPREAGETTRSDASGNPGQ